MDANQAAAALDGTEYRAEWPRDLLVAMRTAGLVAITGASDDLADLAGAIRDEVPANGRKTTLLLKAGGLVPYPACDCDEARELHEIRAAGAAKVTVEFSPEDRPGLTWRVTTGLPHARFTIVEDGEPFCEGIVIALSDCAAAD